MTIYLNYIEALHTINGDIKVKCVDGELSMISNIVSARSEYMKKLLSESFREGREKVVTFQYSVDVMTIIINYLQFNDKPNLCIEDYTLQFEDDNDNADETVFELAKKLNDDEKIKNIKNDRLFYLFDLLLTADEFCIQDLISHIHDAIFQYACHPSYAVHIYARCPDHFDSIKTAAFTTICLSITNKNIKYECNECRMRTDSPLMKCGNSKCSNLYSRDVEYCTCGYKRTVIVTTCYQKSCNGKLKLQKAVLNIDNISDVILSELMKKVINLNT